MEAEAQRREVTQECEGLPGEVSLEKTSGQIVQGCARSSSFSKSRRAAGRYSAGRPCGHVWILKVLMAGGSLHKGSVNVSGGFAKSPRNIYLYAEPWLYLLGSGPQAFSISSLSQ